MLLDGRELAGYIKERQAQEVRRLRAQKIFPKLAIVLASDDPASAAYTKLKQEYGQDLGVEVVIHKTGAKRIEELIQQLNHDDSVSGIIVQLPLPAELDADRILNLVNPNKDVDGLGKQSQFTPATPTAILWLLAGYNIDLKDKQVAVVGQGRLVGAPLTKILERSQIKVAAYDKFTTELVQKVRTADVIITATGQPKLVTADMVKEGAVVIDAGTADEAGKLIGDVDTELYQRADLKISPVPGGVGPLTVCALFDNLLQASRMEGNEQLIED